MLPAFKLMARTAVVLVPLAVLASASSPDPGSDPSALRSKDMVELGPGAIRYRASGEFQRHGKPATAPMVNVTIDRPIAVMRHQVTASDYRRCVDAQACPMVGGDAAAPDRPVVGVSWRDAQAYASWLSLETGLSFRLPTDEEWAYLAGSRYRDDALPESLDSSGPGQRILAIYDRDAGRERVDAKVPRPIGSFGANEHGLLDLAGNVWEWTDTCFQRSSFDAAGRSTATVTNCGVRVVEGRHRAYMTDFVRDARPGGCVAGTPPSNLGFRLVRDDQRWWRVPLDWLRRSHGGSIARAAAHARP
ncbi:SUMF1/EgtB/PvdO family nonheme iron enzyme [Bosea sp. BIWAKO-01]|uniref:formylglycine-generating enzyme family protein n=1 Tax=Bosea sp. BIWAKO-01 TaxID=506668 RepID=UPI000853B2BE|nr:SUMF1/EgtB/PvdO family nonheme iron enzyme [Bosea sp. BIWAKO-01]GAU86881.1 nitrite reductase accessory protein NirV [Bosea sp. BIWAKO-01]